MNHWTVFGLHLLLKKYFVPELDQDLRLLFVQMKGKTKKNKAQAPKRGVTIFDPGSVFEERSNASVGSHC